MKKQFDYNRSANEMALELNGGNPGSLNVCRQLLSGLQEEDARNFFTIMADMDIRGVLIYVAFTNCDRSIQTLLDRVANRDSTLVEAINAEREREGMPERAIVRGAIEWPDELPMA